MQQSSLKESRKNNNGHNGSHGKPKFQQERVDKVNKNLLTALNAKQQKYIDSLEDGVSVIVATGFPGCVDKHTEFLSQNGWKKISDYDTNDLVMQISEYGLNASLVKPLNYIKKPCDTFYHFKNERGIDQMLSSEHNIAYTVKNFLKLNKKSVSEVVDKLNINNNFTGYVPTIFNYQGHSLNLSENEIRLGVAIKADAFLATKSTGRYVFRLKKQRKIDRLLNILKDLNKDYKLKYEEKTGFTVITIYSQHTKSYKDWMFCSKEDALVIFDEYKYWDGDSSPKGNRLSRFSTSIKEEADAMQYVMTLCGYRTTISTSVKNSQITSNNKTYFYEKSTMYIVCPTKQTHIAITPLNKKTNIVTKPKVIKVTDEFKYCFEVPTGYLVLRRNDKIFITGNSSKTFIPTKFACQKLLLDRLYKLVLTRPAISNSKSLGYFAGSLEEKISIWLAPVLSTVKETLGREAASIAIKNEDITFIPLEVIKGTSLSSNDPNRRIIFLVDEAEDLSKEEVIKIVTRIGKNCTLVLAGDILQSELKENSGLLWLINFIKNNNLPDFVHIDFNDVNDIVRSDTVKRFITCLQRENKKQNESQKSGSNGSHS